MTRTRSNDRRNVLQGLMAAGLGGGSVAWSGAVAAPASKMFAYVGGFTSKQRDGRSQGIDIYEVEPSGTWRLRQKVKTSNPCWLLADARRHLLFCANADENYLSAFRMDAKSGQLSDLTTASTGGLSSLYLTFDPSGRFLISANYGSGNLTVFAIDDSKGFGPRTDVFGLTGTPGPRRAQQVSSEPHQAVFDPTGKFIVVPNRGVDKIHVLSLSPATGKLNLISECIVRSGTGPRHAVFHPEKSMVYVLSELGSLVTSYLLDEKGTLKPQQILSTLPDDFFGENAAAEICFDSATHTLYVSNRGHNSVAGLAVDRETGRMRVLGWTATGGGNPRFMILTPKNKSLLVLNQDSDAIVEFPLASNGQLQPGATVTHSGSPGCLLFNEI